MCMCICESICCVFFVNMRMCARLCECDVCLYMSVFVCSFCTYVDVSMHVCECVYMRVCVAYLVLSVLMLPPSDVHHF